MSTAHELKSRIKSVKNTKQITKAMQLVSVSKMKQADVEATESLPYAQGLNDLVSQIGAIKDYKSPFTRTPKKIKKIMIVIVGPTRGFVGGLTSNLTINTQKEIEKISQKYPDAKIEALTIHKLGKKIAEYTGLQAKYHFSQNFEHPNTTMLSPVYKVIIDAFKKEETDMVFISYMHFINVIKQKAEFKKILPISVQKISEGGEQASNQAKDKEIEKQKAQPEDMIYEPTKKKILDELLPEYFETQILSAIFESNASEHAARMVAMKNATENATELVDKLSLKFNKTRQAAITQEILEVASGTLN